MCAVNNGSNTVTTVGQGGGEVYLYFAFGTSIRPECGTGLNVIPIVTNSINIGTLGSLAVSLLILKPYV